MPPLSVRLAVSRFLDPALLLVVALAVVLYVAFRDLPAERSRRRARAAVWGVWALFWALSTPFVSDHLVAAVEMRGPDLDVALAGKDRSKVALVVLGGGVRTYAPTPTPRERLSGPSLQRAITAARLWHEQRFGLVVISSMPIETEAIVDLMTALGVPAAVLVREDRSLNTRDNAAYSSEIVKERGMEAVVVVTSALHLRRSLKDFAQVGVHAIPAAADILGRTATGIDDFLPAAHALERTHTALHEILGYVRG
jgi:uncharacterized SAM-binding protein YcdF (DUF218 family)